MDTMESKVNNSLRQLDFGLDTRRAFDTRMAELNLLAKELKPKSNKLTMQQLPRFMRRRAASHNPKRLPLRLRTIGGRPNANINAGIGAGGRAGGGQTIGQNSKKRKKRMKHLGLRRKKYSIRMRNRKPGRHLLHVWFRKRFAMQTQSGVQMPMHNNTKNFRNLHQKSSRKCVYFHLPMYAYCHVRCNRQQLQSFYEIVSQLTNNTHRIHRLQQLKKKELTFDYVDNQRWKSFFKLIHTHQSADGSTHDFLITAPLLVQQKLCDQLKSFSSSQSSFQVLDCGKRFQRFRLIGPDAMSKLSQVVSLICQNKSIDRNSDFVNEMQKKMNFDLPNPNDGRLRLCNGDAFYDGPANQLSLLLIDQPFEDHNRNRSHCLDVIVPSRCAKRFWYMLVRNRSHLVGGLQNLLYFALERNALCFPFTGSCDGGGGGAGVVVGCESSQNRYKLLQLIARLFDAKMKNDDDDDDDDDDSKVDKDQHRLIVERKASTLETLSKGIKMVDEKLAEIIGLDNRLLNCKIQMFKRGIANEDDLIYLPTVADLCQLFPKIKNNRKRSASAIVDQNEESSSNDFEPVEKVKLRHLRSLNAPTLRKMSRIAIGCVEYGQFSLHSGKGEAMALILMNSFVRLVQIHRQTWEQVMRPEVMDDNCGTRNRLFVLTRNQNSNQFRFGQLFIDVKPWFF